MRGVKRSIAATACFPVLFVMAIAQTANAADYLSVQGISVAASTIHIASGEFDCSVGVAAPDAALSAVGAAISDTSAVHPIWQIDVDRQSARRANAPAARFNIGYIADDYQVADDASAVLLGAPQKFGADRIAASDAGVGIRLDNGWSLGLTYETIDTSTSDAPTAGRSSIGPVYEGPLFVATVKF